MTEMQTLADKRRGEVEAARHTAEETLQRLEEERQALSPEALGGDKEAADKLEKLEQEAIGATRTRALADAALYELDRRDEEERTTAEEERQKELATRYDELVKDRRSALKRLEKALDALQSACDAVLEVDGEQRKVGVEVGHIDHSVAGISLTLKDRLLTRFSDLLGTGPATRRPHKLTEDSDVLTRTIAESEGRKEEARKVAEEARREEQRVREAVERAEKIQHRRAELLAGSGYTESQPAARVEIEARVEEWLRQEFEAE